MRLPSFLFAGLTTAAAAVVGHATVSTLSQQASSAYCASNLKSLVTATAHFAADHEGRLPTAVDRTPKPWKWWYSELFPYVETMKVFYCPEKAPDFYGGSDFSPLLPAIWDFRFLSYGYNMEVDLAQRGGASVLLSGLKDPARILFAESNDYFIHTSRDSWTRYLAPRHEGRAHFAFSDGSVVLDLPGPPPSPKGAGVHQLSNWRIQ